MDFLLTTGPDGNLIRFGQGGCGLLRNRQSTLAIGIPLAIGFLGFGFIISGWVRRPGKPRPVRKPYPGFDDKEGPF